MNKKIDVNLLSGALIISAFAVMRDPRLGDIVVSTVPYPHVCFSCSGSACGELVWRLAGLIEDVCRTAVVEERLGEKRVCLKCVYISF